MIDYMSAGLFDFTIEQGTTLDLTITWKDSTNALVNLTGYTARMQIRPDIASATVLYELNTSPTTGQGTITLGGAAGTIRLQASAAHTAAFNWAVSSGSSVATAVYDLELTSGSGVVTRLVKGTVSLDFEVTR